MPIYESILLPNRTTLLGRLSCPLPGVKSVTIKKRGTLNLKRIKGDVSVIGKLLGIDLEREMDLGLNFISSSKIRTYNKQYRGKDRVTDVLSFPDALASNASTCSGAAVADSDLMFERDDGELPSMGDTFIALPYVLKSNCLKGLTWRHMNLPARKRILERRLDKRLLRVLVHSMCHLVGYDHETMADYKVMHQKEMEISRHFPRNKHLKYIRL